MSKITDLTSAVADLVAEVESLRSQVNGQKVLSAKDEAALDEALAAARAALSSEATGPAPASEGDAEAAAQDPSGTPGT